MIVIILLGFSSNSFPGSVFFPPSRVSCGKKRNPGKEAGFSFKGLPNPSDLFTEIVNKTSYERQIILKKIFCSLLDWTKSRTLLRIALIGRGSG